MGNLVSISRVTVIADARLEDTLVKQITRLGAKGYTCSDCRGRGEHEIVQDLFTGASRVRLETIVQPAVAEAIMKYLHQPQFQNQALCACVDTVQVGAAEQF